MVEWENNNSIVEQLQQIQNKITDINTHSFVELAKLQKNGERLFHSLFVFENYPAPEANKYISNIQIRKSVEKIDYPLSILAFDFEQTLTITLQYDEVYLSKQKALKHTKTLERILSQIIEAPQLNHNKITLIDKEQYNTIINAWNQTRKEFPENKTLQIAFEEQVNKTPHSTALVFDGKKLSYQELNQKSNQLARRIRKQYQLKTESTLTPDTLIALYLDRGLEMVVGILAVLKAGGAYVPMDMNYPKERIDFMLEDTKAEIILSQKSIVDNNNNNNTLPIEKIITIDLNSNIYTNEEDTNLKQCSAANDLAYVIYTSGTTGKPKGVMIEHKGVINLIQNEESLVVVLHADKILQFASYVFDASVFEIFIAITNGGELHITPNEIRQDATLLCEYIDDNNINTALIPPTIVSRMPYKKLSNFSTLIVGGEACSEKLMQQWNKDRILINAYGPTEDTVCATMHKYANNDNHTNIGKPISNNKAYILNTFNSPVPIGVAGELHIGGAGLARGYLYRPELTQECFISNPFATETDIQNGYNKLYKTGDLVKWLPNGDLEFIGRNDDQIKIRGFRIELGEIEHALSQVQGIKQCTILAKERTNDSGTTKFLAAYYVPNTLDSLSHDEILDKLALLLPVYMVPSILIELEKFPLTINGKLDKKALPEPNFTSSQSDFTPAANQIQQQICDIWKEVLGIEKVGITENFFRIGGNSILAIQVSHRMSKFLDREINVANIFNYKTILQILNHSIDKIQIKIPRLDSDQAILSFSQERLWFIEQYEKGTNAYHIPAVLELNVDTDVKGIVYALKKIVARHEILRSTIKYEENKEYNIQKVHNEPLLVEELQLTFNENYKAIIKKDINTPFDLKNEYPIKAKIYTIISENDSSKNKTLLLVNTHHIASDGWSMDIFQKELFSYYNAYSKNNKSFNLPPLEIHYKDFASWERSYLTGDTLQKQLNYWKNKLNDYQTLELPTDFVRPAQINYAGDIYGFTLDKNLSKELRKIAKKHATTLHCVLLSGLHILLNKYTGQDDIVIGSPFANRHHSQTKDLIGFFVNTQANRALLSNTQTYNELIQQVHHDQIEAQQYQDLPFEKLVDELGVTRDTSRHPIFQITFAVQNFGNNKNESQQQKNFLKPFIWDKAYEIEKFDLSIFIDDSHDELIGQLSYATSLFNRNTISRLYKHLHQLLKGLVENPTLPYSQIGLLDANEYNTIIHQWNKTTKKIPRNKTIYLAFEEQVFETPEATAVVFENKQLTYRQLNEKSNQLARHIRKQHELKTGSALTPDTFIALFLARGLEMIVGILAVLKAGGAYVPMDIHYPKERIDFMLEDTKAQIILSQKSIVDNNNSTLPLDKVITIDLDSNSYTNEETYNLDKYCTAKDLAYVIYTSGTTGKPKGVMVEHYSVMNLITDLQDKYSIDSSENILLFANYIFDASVEQMYLSLLSGSSLFITNNAAIENSIDFENFINTNKITHLHATPSYLNNIDPAIISNCNRIIFGAEYLNKKLFENYKKHIPIVINEYGPTETTITTLVSINNHLLNKASIQNTSAYILDLQNSPVPIGVAGELHIGGAGLARGYLNRPELTQERFIINPFATENDVQNGYTKLYKTGDLVKWLPNGNLEYIGRNDEQIKIRGFRIELGEIENALSSLNEISANTVIVREDDKGNKQLVAYIVPDSNISLDKSNIRKQLLNILPDYMVPSLLIIMSALPMTINGKLDKKALPDPVIRTENSDKAQKPQTAIEKQLVIIWEEILNIENIGIHDNFFELGGHSLLTIALISKINKRYKNKISVSIIFQYQTIKQLSEYLESSISYEWTPIVPIQKEGNMPPIYLISGITMDASTMQPLSKHFNKNQVVFGLEYAGLDYGTTAMGSIEEIASSNLEALHKIKATPPYIFCGYSFGGMVAFEMAKQLLALGETQVSIILI
ncbi:MAG: amino acid adenylation domain-containing protein, partial [Prolixibacteraceae bacterium]|nr:amino acid adenylation domain-containing protein [Prolixibacteraceae bacterium]